MKIEYFDTEQIYSDASGDCLETYEKDGFSHRWIQPPVVCYFVSTKDKKGNVNVAPISMGTAMFGEPPEPAWYYGFDVQNSRQTRDNLLATGECVISYFTASQIRESWVTGLPLPRGINECEVAGMTPMASKKVSVPCIKECVSNMECKLIETVAISNSTIFVVKVVAVHVHANAIESDRKTELEPGIAKCDLLYEVSIKGNPPRLNYMKMNMDDIYSTDANLGSDYTWIGSYEEWMKAEVKRGRITEKECTEMITLKNEWRKNPDPKKNYTVKEELTMRLKNIVEMPLENN